MSFHSLTSANVNAVTHGLRAWSFLPNMVRLSVFKFGVLNDGFLQQIVLNRFQNHFSGNGYFGCRGNYDMRRVQRGVELLLNLGGVEKRVIPKDGEADLQMITLSAANLREKIENLGGSWENGVIKSPHSSSPEWDDFYDNSLTKIFPNQSEQK